MNIDPRNDTTFEFDCVNCIFNYTDDYYGNTCMLTEECTDEYISRTKALINPKCPFSNNASITFQVVK